MMKERVLDAMILLRACGREEEERFTICQLCLFALGFPF